jgi:hypothetical protein
MIKRSVDVVVHIATNSVVAYVVAIGRMGGACFPFQKNNLAVSLRTTVLDKLPEIVY